MWSKTVCIWHRLQESSWIDCNIYAGFENLVQSWCRKVQNLDHSEQFLNNFYSNLVITQRAKILTQVLMNSISKSISLPNFGIFMTEQVMLLVFCNNKYKK